MGISAFSLERNDYKGRTMIESAKNAIYAAKHRKQWGRYATLRYVQKYSTLSAYRLACQLEAVK